MLDGCCAPATKPSLVRPRSCHFRWRAARESEAMRARRCTLQRSDLRSCRGVRFGRKRGAHESASYIFCGHAHFFFFYSLCTLSKPTIPAQVVAEKVAKAARVMSNLSWVGFWGQLILSVVSAVIIVFSIVFKGVTKARVNQCPNLNRQKQM